jgi:hypothetical protein
MPFIGAVLAWPEAARDDDGPEAAQGQLLRVLGRRNGSGSGTFGSGSRRWATSFRTRSMSYAARKQLPL